MTAIGVISQKDSVIESIVEWSIKDFLSIPAKIGVHYFSPDFSFANESWWLRIFPNGGRLHGTKGIIELYLHRYCSVPRMKIEITLGVKTVDGKLDPERHFTKAFDDNMCSISFFIRRSELLKRKSDLLPSDTLTLVCKMKRKGINEAANLRSSNYTHENKVLQDYKQLFLNRKECDAIIRVKEQEFSAHKTILAARSPVFESTFRSDMKEKESGIVDVEDCDPSSFSDFLCFLYCGEIETLSEKNVFSLFTTADKYDVQDLKDICVKFMKENISVDTFCDTISLALLHCESELVTLATDFFTKNARKIAKTVAWQRFSADNPTQSNELFIKALDAAAGSNE